MSSNAGCASVFSFPVSRLEYRNITRDEDSDLAEESMLLISSIEPESKRTAEVELTKEELDQLLRNERATASARTEQSLRAEYETKLQECREVLAKAVADFGMQRSDYFARIEVEVVQLALAIAAKILHREAQVDPMLVAALVRMTLEKMREGSSVTIRVSAGRATAWREYFAGRVKIASVIVAEDPSLTENDCIVETELGSTNFALDQQLKEVEQGFFDLLALRPETR